MDEENKKEIVKDKINRFFLDYFIWINLFIVLIIFLLGVWFLIMPKYKNVFIKTINPKAEVEGQYLEKSRELADIDELISAYYNVSERDREKIYLMIPDKAGAEELIRDMENIARNNGLILESVRAEAAEEEDLSSANYFVQQKASASKKVLPGGVGVVEIEMNLIGTDYYSLKELLKTIENNVRLLDVDSISFNPNKENTNLKITAYYIKN